MKSNTKRLVSVLLCLAMVLAVMPMVFAADTTTLYCDAPDDWTCCYVFWWGSADNNPGWPGVAMTQDAKGIWVGEVASDATYVIFTNKEDGSNGVQSSDLNMPTGTDVQYNYEGKVWGAYGLTVAPAEVEYFLRGTMNEWRTANKMEKQTDGTYAVTLELAAGTYEYKAGSEDWGFSVPVGDNAVLTLTEAADVTFILNVEEGTLTNDAPDTELPELEPGEYYYYVAGSAGLCGKEWDPAAKVMTEIEPGIWEITLRVFEAGTYEYKVTTGSWETPSYGYGEGNYTVVVKNPGEVTITFNEETQEVTCDVYEFGEAKLKFQLNADASADDETVNLRMITYVNSLDYASVMFYITIEGEVATWECEAVYESINVSGDPMTCEDIFGEEGYLVTFTLTDIPAAFYGSDIQVSFYVHTLDGSSLGTSPRTVVLSDILG